MLAFSLSPLGSRSLLLACIWGTTTHVLEHTAVYIILITQEGSSSPTLCVSLCQPKGSFSLLP